MLEKGAGVGGGGLPMKGGESPYSLNSRRVQLRLRQVFFVRPLKTEYLLLSGCAAFALLLLCTGLADRSPSRHSRSSLLPGKGYTILINTWKRNDLLQQSIAHYTSCSGVESIRIVWSEPDPPPDSLRDILLQSTLWNSKGCEDIDLLFELNQEDSLNNRFKEIEDLNSDALFSVDDDVLLPCASLELAFSVWRSAPSSMVGFVPRMHSLDKRGKEEMYTYRGWWSVWWTGTYSMVLSKAAFFHRKYLYLYTNNMHPAIREYVTINRNCEDIAMSFLIANETGAPPIWVKGKIFEIGSTGISSLGGHSEQRSKCLNDFAAIYGHMPLVATSAKVIDSRNTWSW